jgi:hypothetical protein
MSRYLEILAEQRPFPFNADESNRVMFSINFRALAEGPTVSWEEELVKVLIDAGLAVAVGTDVFVGPIAVVPLSGDGPFINVIDTGGTAPDETHNGSIYERLSAQLVIRAKDYTVARTRALAVWRALDGIRNTTIAA